jgi:uncharacterized protein Veg
MDFEKQAHVVDNIRNELVSRLNTRLRVRANLGRSKIVEAEGTLIQAHPSLFIMEIERRRGRKARQSYQYVDILTGTVQLFDAETGEEIFAWLFEDDGQGTASDDEASGNEDEDEDDEEGEDDEDL